VIFQEEILSTPLRTRERSELDQMLAKFLAQGGSITRVTFSTSEMLRHHYKQWTSKVGKQFAHYEKYQKRKPRKKMTHINKYCLPCNKTLVVGEKVNDHSN
jgi:hypothetical protein